MEHPELQAYPERPRARRKAHPPISLLSAADRGLYDSLKPSKPTSYPLTFAAALSVEIKMHDRRQYLSA